jgi:putative SOS response-associated peptidase YedK
MCNRYSHTKGPMAIGAIAIAMGGDWLDSLGNLEPQPSIFPDATAPVVRSRPEGGRELVMRRWGFPIPEPRSGEKKKSGYQSNIRQPRWKQWLPWMEVVHRCLVPAVSFSEYDWRTTPPTVT